MKITNLKINKRAKAMFAATVMLLSQGCGRQIEEISRPTKPSKPSISQTQTETTTVELTTEQITEMVTKPKETEYQYPEYDYPDYDYPDYDYPEYIEPQSPVEQSTQAPTQKQTDVTTELNEPTINETTNITEEEPTMNETTKATTSTTKATTKPKQTTTTKTTTKVTTTKPKQTTTTKATTKATTTTKQTTKATTTTTKATTTTTTTQAPSSGYSLNDITTNADAFRHFAAKYNYDLLRGNGIQRLDRVTYGSKEAPVMLAILNYGYINDNVIKEIFQGYTQEEIREGIGMYYGTASIQKTVGTQIDFAKYTLNKTLGADLNEIDSAYRNGQIDSFAYDIMVNGNIKQEYMTSPAYLGMLASYNKGKLISEEAVDYQCMDAFGEYVSNIAIGKAYIK